MSDRRERLVRLRDQQEAALALCSVELLPQLSGQYRATLVEIDEIDSAGATDDMRDDLRDQRQRRMQKRRTG